MKKIVRLLVGGLVLALATAAVAIAARPYKGTVYKGTTSQNGKVRFKTSKDGKRVGSFDFGVAQIQCDTSPAGQTTEMRLKFGGTLKVGGDGRFNGTVPDSVTNEGAITIRGRFTSRGRAEGKVSYADRGCIGQNTLTWKVKRPPPPVKPYKNSVFKGKTSQNGAVRFRTSRDGKRVWTLDFGNAQIQCDTAEPGVLVTQRLKFPGTLRIRNGRFRGTLPPDSNEGAIRVSGKFTSRGRATGTVSYLDRGCIGTNPLTWNATRR